MSMKTNIYKTNYNAYQPYLLLDFSFSFENTIPHDDISRTVIEIVERINLGHYIDFDNRNAHGYNAVMIFTLVLLAKTLFGYVSTRDLVSLCKTDVRFMTIAQNKKTSHQSFHRFIHDDLTMAIEDIFYDINKYMESYLDINTDVLCIDGTNMKRTPIQIRLFGVKIPFEIERKDGNKPSLVFKESIGFFIMLIFKSAIRFSKNLALSIY